jgi:hypothetical protein
MIPQRALETSVEISGAEGAIAVRIDGAMICIGSQERSISLSLDDFGLVIAEVAAYRRAVEAAAGRCSKETYRTAGNRTS